ncbi:MAG: hypothetical protein JXA17_09015 [Dehalococcoidales bacterium]|nr:hypothetical protein [Dehalococcoidales bacterium]
MSKFGATPTIEANVLNTSSSLFYPIFQGVFDIPIVHLILGIILKTAIFFLLYLVIYELFKKHSIAVIAIIFFFYLHMGSSSTEIQGILAFTSRQFSTIFILLSLLFFIKRRYLFASLAMGLAITFQSLNAVHLFAVSIFVLILLLIIEKEGWPRSIKKLISYLAPCLVIGLIMYLRIQLTNPVGDVTPLSVEDWWNFGFANEGNDVSLMHRLSVYGYSHEMIYSVVALILIALNVFIIKKHFPKYDIASKPILIIAALFILISWCEIAFGLFWERFLVYFPDFINDIFIPWEFHKGTYISALFYIPVLALAVIQITMVVANFIIGKAADWLKLTVRWLLVEKRLACLFFIVMLALSVILSKHFYNPQNVAKYWNAERQPYAFFANEADYEYISYFSPLTWPAIVEIGEWIRNNTPENALIFTLPYVKEAAVLADRLYFLNEKFDGDLATLNRKYATYYLTKFSGMLDGLSYDDFEKTDDEGGESYVQIRERYLSLTTEDFMGLLEQYPGYNYILTEKGHKLDFELVYSNAELLVYKIQP